MMPLMFTRISHTQLLRYAGLFTWAMVGIPLLLNSSYFPTEEGIERVAAQSNLRWWLIAYIAFGIGYWASGVRAGTTSCCC